MAENLGSGVIVPGSIPRSAAFQISDVGQVIKTFCASVS